MASGRTPSVLYFMSLVGTGGGAVITVVMRMHWPSDGPGTNRRRPQGLGLPSAPVQGQDEQFPQALAQRVFPAQRLQFAGQFPVPPQAQVGAGPGFGRHQGQLVQPGPFGIKMPA